LQFLFSSTSYTNITSRAKQARKSCQPSELPQQNQQPGQQNRQLSGQTNKDKPAQQK
jgi:hypothetical protein